MVVFLRAKQAGPQEEAISQAGSRRARELTPGDFVFLYCIRRYEIPSHPVWTTCGENSWQRPRSISSSPPVAAATSISAVYFVVNDATEGRQKCNSGEGIQEG